MSAVLHVRPRPLAASGGSVTATAALDFPAGGSFELWYRLPERFAAMLAGDCDPFVIAAVFPAMSAGADVAVHGRASPSLLANLEEFTAAWACWWPGRYRRVSFRADDERESVPVAPDAAVLAFSGGLDSAFTAWRHFRGLAGRRNLRIRAGVLVHGFDIPLEDSAAFAAASRHAQAMLSSVGAEFIPVSTNMRAAGGKWLATHGAALFSCLALLKSGYSAGVIASSAGYSDMGIEVGSNPATDQFLSSDSFRSVHDGAEYLRYGKIPDLAAWPEALAHLRVCFDDRGGGDNCCRCVKCIETALAFRAQGLPVPPAFPVEPGLGDILRLKMKHRYYLGKLGEIAELAGRRGLGRTAWGRAVRLAAARNALRLGLRELRGRWRRMASGHAAAGRGAAEAGQ
jgi:hypothetical protein